MELSAFIEKNRSKMNEIEEEFVRSIFYPYAGERGLDYLQVQTPFEDSQAKKRKLDFTIRTDRYSYCIEIDGYTYHAEGALRVSEDYFDDLLVKQNDLILCGWKLIRFSYNQIRKNPVLCIDTLRRAFKSDPQINPIYRNDGKIEPTLPQKLALEAIDFNRSLGKNAGVVVLATGLGKTFLAAMDAQRIGGRTLFIVHQENILKQAFESFDIVWLDVTKGYFKADEKTTDAQVIFASKDTLYRDGNLERFRPDEFDYIIIDEVHHSACMTYRKILNYFTPKYMLGLTATPYRQDRADILELFDYNLYFEYNQVEAIESGYLTGFKYYGLKDNIDYRQIRHNGKRYDVTDLGRHLNIPERNEAIFNKFKEICPDAKALGFCVTIQHAIDMAKYFNERGIRAEAIHSDTSKLSPSQRAAFIEDFKQNSIQVLFTVDVFNEGVDFPDVNALLFLRPTESKTIFTQQLGRGLRLSPYKDNVIVLDFIGNFKNAHLIKEYLPKRAHESNESNGQGTKKFTPKEYLDWPLGCDVIFEESVEEMFRKMEQETREITAEELIENYYKVKEAIQKKPSRDDINLSEVSRYRIADYDKVFGSWTKFLKDIGEATEASYHYPQGTHLGHIFYIIYSIGNKNLCERLHEDTYAPPEGQTLSKLGRQTRYKVWACMELGLLYDDRQPNSSRKTYQNLTEKGKKVYEILKEHVSEPEIFFSFRDVNDDDERKISWDMGDEYRFNKFIKELPSEKFEVLKEIFFSMDAVKHMLKFLFHVNQNNAVLRKDEIYKNYFNAPFIRKYFEQNGIEQDSEEGARRRLPFILNILESFKVIQFVGRSEIEIIQLPLVPHLFSEDKQRQVRNLEYVRSYYKNSSEPLDHEVIVELRSLFGKDFLTPNYFIKRIE
jgi:superfamily II DNA or RNA helicase